MRSNPITSRNVALPEWLSGTLSRDRRLVLTIVGIFLVTSLLRLIRLTKAYDIFLDEITYFFLSSSVAENLTVQLHGEWFYLHPPAFFFLEGSFLKLFSPQGDLIQMVYAVRHLNVILAGVSGVLIYLIARTVVGNSAGIVAALLYAIEPFSVRMGSRNMLEVSAVMWALAGLLILARHIKAGRQSDLSPRQIVAVGLLFGLAVQTKDMMVFLTLVPLAICAAIRCCLTRRSALYIALITVLVYVIYPLTVLFRGDMGRYLEKKTRGVARLIGLVQETGFNRPVGPGLLSSLVDKLGEFGPSYLLFAIGGLALLYLWTRKDQRLRLIAVWTTSAYLLLAYLIPVGTLETQFFYYLLVPAALSISVATDHIMIHRVTGAVPRWMRLDMLLLLALIFIWSTVQWIGTRIGSDNGYEQVLAYVEDEIPPQMRISSTSETGQFLLDNRASGPWGSWHTLESLAQHKPNYLIVSKRQMEWDFGQDALPLLLWLSRNGQPVFSFEGRTNEELLVYYLPPASWLTQSQTSPVPSPPPSGG